jgi:O-antigen/teichoic acid export membrane protein
MGKIKERVRIMVISTILTIAITIWTIPFIGIYGAIAGFCIGQLSLFIMSYRVVDKEVKIVIDWFFVVKNSIFIAFLGVLIWYIKSNVFVFDDAMRYSNFWKLVIVGLVFYILFGILNRKQVTMLKQEIWKLRK